MKQSALLLAGAILLDGGASATAANNLPKIQDITTSQQSDGTYTVTIAGHQFGAAPAGIPCTGCQPQQLLLQAAGLFGTAIDVTSWTNKQIVVSGVNLAANTAFTVAVWNEKINAGVTGGSIASPATGGPVITSMQESGTGADLTVTIHGSGFGTAPAGVVGQNGNSAYFSFIDYNAQAPNSGNTGDGGYPWNAGYTGDGVTVTIASWTDSKIVMSGFGGGYGSNDWSWNPGDAFCVNVWPSTSAGGSSGSAIRCARLPS